MPQARRKFMGIRTRISTTAKAGMIIRANLMTTARPTEGRMTMPGRDTDMIMMKAREKTMIMPAMPATPIITPVKEKRMITGDRPARAVMAATAAPAITTAPPG